MFNRTIFSILPAIFGVLPLFLVVLAGVIYAFARRDIGRPANFVIIGGCLVLLAQLVNMAVTVSLTTGLISTETYAAIAAAGGLVHLILGTGGWGMIIFAVFLDRGQSET